ncbi:G-protein coupled receptor [Dermatophagoides farinae]|uniref:G-protein coupled receptor n=1 Tax=Dermatophagoides farinae TaxID=6954 RepID=A0A922HTJ2_DERFA|nr:G-protein coupled receptor [Dermatophagoides farinae]
MAAFSIFICLTIDSSWTTINFDNNETIPSIDDDLNDESYRRLFHQLLSHPNVLLNSNENESSSSSSSSLPAKEASNLYHIIIANSTTSLPLILVTATNDGNIVRHHYFNQTATAELLESPSMIHLRYLQSSSSSSSNINNNQSDDNDNHSSISINHLPTDTILQLIESMYLKTNDKDDYDDEYDDDQSTQQVRTYDDIQQEWIPSSTTTDDPMESFSSSSNNDNNDPESSLPESLKNNHYIRNTLVIISYSMIMFLSLCGNYLVLHVIYTTPKLRTTTNILIFSLTISDLMTTIFNIPFNCARFLLRNWPFPDSFCIIMPTLQVTSVYVSTLTMAAICLHRYRSILGTTGGGGGGGSNVVISSRIGFNHITHSMSSVRIKMSILFIWIISILLALPHTLFNLVVWD